ncbi:hypothetical protein [Marinitoga lauensis]|nr:hypothetical protein [Marinitoga lauensis]
MGIRMDAIYEGNVSGYGQVNHRSTNFWCNIHKCSIMGEIK